MKIFNSNQSESNLQWCVGHNKSFKTLYKNKYRISDTKRFSQEHSAVPSLKGNEKDLS